MTRGIVFVGAALLATGMGAFALLHDWPVPFDSNRWQAEERFRDGKRLTMADDLIRRKLLDGKTREEVLQLLGDPPETEYFSDWEIVYRLGPERGFISVDSEWLVLRFGEDGRVAEYKLTRD